MEDNKELDDSNNKTLDIFERPLKGLCVTCNKNCYTSWIIDLCSDYEESK